MFLDPQKIKDYMHVEDFCNSVVRLIDSNIRNEDFNQNGMLKTFK